MGQPAVTDETGFAAETRPAATGLRAIFGEIGRDRLLYALIGLYLLGGWVVAEALGRPQFYKPLIYMADRLPAFGLAVMLYVALFELPLALRDNPRQPMSGLAARLKRHANPRLAAGLLLFLAIGLFTGAFTSMKTLQTDLTPFWADVALARIDAGLHFGVDPWRFIQPLLGYQGVTRVIQNLYLNGWVMMLVTFTAMAAFWPRLAHLRTRFFVTYIATWILLGNVLATALMSGGPVYFGELTGDDARFAEQLRYLSFTEGLNNSSVDLQHMLWRLHDEGRLELGSGISAFPSLHVAMATLFAILAFHIDRRLGWAVATFAVLIQLGSVHLAWHYAIDGYFSAVFVIALWFGVGLALKRLRPAA